MGQGCRLLSLTEFKFKFLWFDSHKVISILVLIRNVVRLRTMLVTARVAWVPLWLY
jgi:hypothetical protein